tara:strand:- start:127 stop:771 length:645 start_codon:yes stop_codon:yes gene_type:complete
MNEKTQLQILKLLDEGATIESSSELKAIVEASSEAKTFYYDILISESELVLFFGGDKAKELSNKIDTYVDEQLNETSKVSSINFKPIVGFAIAASMAAIAFTFFNSPFQLSESIEVIYEDPQIVEVEETEPLFISGEDMINGLWGPSSELAKQIGRDRYEIMYVVYEANKENFIDNNINQPIQDRNFSVDLSLVDNLDKGFVIDEVKRHIFCSC